MENGREIAAELIRWIQERSQGRYETEESAGENNQSITIKTADAVGRVNVHFLEYVIAEYTIEDGSGENSFYFHFELTDAEHAKHVFLEMEDCLLKKNEKKKKQILLCCTCGLTTSYFTMKLNEISEQLGLDMEFSAVPYEHLFENTDDKDAVMIAPQMGFRYKSVKEVLTDTIVIQIPVVMFSQYDAPAVIRLLTEPFSEVEKKEKQKAEESAIQKLYGKNGTVLIVSVIYMEGRNQIAYRLYDRDFIIAENQITKETYQLRDILDVIHTVRKLNPELKHISVVTPGMIENGKLTYEDVNIVDYDLCASIKEDFEGEVTLFNTTDMITLGYSAKECPDHNCAFYFVPTGSYAGNIGIAANGGLLDSGSHMGDRQLQAVTDITAFPKNPYALQRTPEGNTELAARYLTGLVSYTGIEHIAFYGKMIPNAEDVREKMKQFIPEQYLPEIVKVDSVRNYLYEGTLRCLKQL